MTRSDEGDAPRDLFHLARLHGVQTRYQDVEGAWRSASPGPLARVLEALGVDAGSEEAVTRSIRRRRRELEGRVLGATTVVRLDEEGPPPAVELDLARAPAGPVKCRLRTEDGRSREWRSTPQSPRSGAGGRGRRVGARIHLPIPLPPGYHELEVEAEGTTHRTLLLAAPPTTWRPGQDSYEASTDDGGRDWGTFLPLYALRSETSWGTGHFGDLERLLGWTGHLGGRVVATLPLLAGAERSPEDARVYSPVSRLFWNEVYVDVEGAPGLQESEEARGVLESPAFRERIRRLREGELVDWRGAVEAKRAVLEPLARDFLGSEGPERIREFIDARPEVRAYARFRAVWEERGEPWRSWPAGLLDDDPGPGDGCWDTFRYHLYAQWLADRQMRRLRDGRGEDGAGLYLDLPLGCDPDGFDIWRHRELFADGASVGSPPDDFYAEGQDWGFPPPLPEVMERSGFAYTRAALRHHMRFASRLRIDHVMGLHRLFWVPRGAKARDGLYVRYPQGALRAVVRIESHRHRTAVVGEDLGTVPREVRRRMARDRMDRTWVCQFEIRPDQDPLLPSPPARSVAALDTHDTATFAGFWKGADIDARKEAELLEPAEESAARETRRKLRSEWVRFLQEEGDAGPDTGVHAPGRVAEATLRYLARSPASLVLVNLEDLWGEERPQNVPGSGPERPNFRRRARWTLEEILASEKIDEFLRGVNRLRRPGSEPGRGHLTTEEEDLA